MCSTLDNIRHPEGATPLGATSQEGYITYCESQQYNKSKLERGYIKMNEFFSIIVHERGLNEGDVLAEICHNEGIDGDNIKSFTDVTNELDIAFEDKEELEDWLDRNGYAEED
jgi:hypothetical protein